MVDGGKVVRVPVSRRSVLKAGMLGAAGATLGGSAAFALGPRRFARAAQGEPGGSLVIGKIADVLGFDPHVEASQVTWEIQAMVYESLVFLDDNLQPAPGLAASWATPDDVTYVFQIRQGVKFHNGRDMTAEDVAYSLQRVLDPATVSWWAVKMGPVLPTDPAVAAADATAEALGTLTTSGPQIGVTVEATGPYEVTATLSQPYSPFLQTLTGTTTSIIPAEEVRTGQIDLATTMVGTGPFQVVEHVEDQRWVFSKFAEYWQEGQPLLDEVIWQVMPDESSRVAALRTGEIQMAVFDNPAMLDLLAGEQTITGVEQTTTNYYILFVNANHPELADQRVRQAISLGIDRQQISQTALFGHATVTGPIAAGFVELASPLEQVPFYTRDVDRARQLLEEAGVGGDLNLTILVTPDIPLTVPMAEVIREQLGEIGIELEIVQRDIATFVDEYAGTEPTAQLTISWWAGYSDPYLILLELDSDLASGFLGLNDPTIDGLIERVAGEVDPAARVTALRELEAAIATAGNFQPLVTRNNFLAYRNDLISELAVANGDGYGLPLWHRVQTLSRLQ